MMTPSIESLGSLLASRTITAGVGCSSLRVTEYQEAAFNGKGVTWQWHIYNLKIQSGNCLLHTTNSLLVTARQEVESRRGAGAGVGVYGTSMNVREIGRGDGVKNRLRGLEGGQKTQQRRGRPTKKQGKGRMSERVASCGSLYDSTNLLLQYCNNGEHISPRTITISITTVITVIILMEAFKCLICLSN